MTASVKVKKNFKNINVFPIAGALGAEIENVNLSENLSNEVVSEIYDALLTYQVIFFRDQKFEPVLNKHLLKELVHP